MEEAWDGLSASELHLRDSLQFELKSEFLINPSIKKNIYKQEFFLFIPNTLQINKTSYSKQQFYLDQTNLIRYKTPKLTFQELLKKNSIKSPLARLQSLWENPQIDHISDELKLLGNIFRGTLQERVEKLNYKLSKHVSIPSIYQQDIASLCSEIKAVRALFINIQHMYLSHPDYHTKLLHLFRYTDEFMSNTIDYKLTFLLETLRIQQDPLIFQESDKQLCELIIEEKNYREQHKLTPHTDRQNSSFDEMILYRQALLKKFMLSALRLNSNRLSFEEQHGHLLGSLAAGIAMFIYMILFWQSISFGINSLPFVLLVVVFYILKDRIKEGVKHLYHTQAYRWFPDYATQIKSPKGYNIGTLKENFSFINKNELPAGILDIRNTAFHDELPALQRDEIVIQYKREVILNSLPLYLEERRRELTTIFRFNLQYFLLKAHDALQPYLQLNPETLNIETILLPKIYHLNIIIRNTYLRSNLQSKIEIKKVRIIVNKSGIKRIEPII